MHMIASNWTNCVHIWAQWSVADRRLSTGYLTDVRNALLELQGQRLKNIASSRAKIVGRCTTLDIPTNVKSIYNLSELLQLFIKMQQAKDPLESD